MNYEMILDSLIKIAKKAGEAILDIYDSNYDVVFKADDSPVTKADLVSNNIIVEGIKKLNLDAGILSEELAEDPQNTNMKYCFIVDPLDGTKEFVNRNGEFTVNIALCRHGQPILGVIYIPVKDELFYALECKGAYLEQSGSKTRITVSDKTKEIRMVVSRSHLSDSEIELFERNKNRISELIKVGSSAKGCYVAAGRAEIYYRFGPTMEWDTAAMHAIAKESGAIVRQMDGSELTYNRTDHLNRKGFYILNSYENYMTTE